ncbi:MAG TPA: hypothetical protein VGP21_02005, partial [Opitutaceae bacterium]|nr:hypothetical protein [Opitutaceae bacterium]
VQGNSHGQTRYCGGHAAALGRFLNNVATKDHKELKEGIALEAFLCDLSWLKIRLASGRASSRGSAIFAVVHGNMATVLLKMHTLARPGKIHPL